MIRRSPLAGISPLSRESIAMATLVDLSRDELQSAGVPPYASSLPGAAGKHEAGGISRAPSGEYAGFVLERREFS
jgi:hypothetical protein